MCRILSHALSNIQIFHCYLRLTISVEINSFYVKIRCTKMFKTNLCKHFVSSSQGGSNSGRDIPKSFVRITSGIGVRHTKAKMEKEFLT